MRLESELDKSLPNIGDIMKLLQEMRKESKDQSKNLETELGKSIEHCHQTIAELRTTIDLQTESLNKYKELYAKLCVENNKLQSRVTELEDRLDDSEQYSRLNTIEINGIPEKADENVLSLVQEVGKSLGLQVNEDMVDACH